MFSRRSLISLVLLSAFLVAPAIGQVAAPKGGEKDVLKLIPEDAWGFVIARSLKTIDEKAVLLKDTLGLPIPAPVTPMALGMLNLGDTVDMTKPVCMVVMDVQKSGGFDRANVVLVPATDPKALIEKLAAPPEGEATEGEEKEELPKGITKCMVMGQPGYAAVKEKYVVFGASHECVANVMKADKTAGAGLDKARRTAIDKGDLYFSISVSTIVGAYKDMVMPIMQMAMAASDPEGKSAEKLIKMFEEMAALDISLSFDKKGLSLLLLTTPKKGSDLEKLFRDTKNTDRTLLSALPKEKYLLALGGTTVYSEHADKFGGPMQLSDILKSLQIEGMDDEAIKSLESGFKGLMKTTRAFAMSVSALPAGPQGMVGLAIVVETDDAEGCVADLRKMYETVWAISDDEDFETIKANVVHKADAETIDGKKVDTITVNLKEMGDLLDLNAEDLGEINKIIGEDLVFRFGPADKKHIVIAFGGGEKRFETICGSVKSASGLSADAGITETARRLPSPRAAECYIALDNVGQLIKNIAKVLGEEEEFPFDVPTIDAPIAISTVQLGSIQRIDIIVPMKLITAVKGLIDKQMSAGFEDFDEDEDEDEDDEDEDAEDKDEDMDEG